MRGGCEHFRIPKRSLFHHAAGRAPVRVEHKDNGLTFSLSAVQSIRAVSFKCQYGRLGVGSWYHQAPSGQRKRGDVANPHTLLVALRQEKRKAESCHPTVETHSKSWFGLPARPWREAVFLQDWTWVDLFSKREDGEARPSRGDRRPSVTEVSAQLLVGEYPNVEDVGWLKLNFDVTAVHNLQDDYDLRHNGLDITKLRQAYEQHRIKLVRTPISDGSADQMALRLETALGDLHALIGSGERVYLHCNAGLNRAPTLAIAYMRAHQGMSLDEAVDPSEAPACLRPLHDRAGGLLRTAKLQAHKP